MVSLLPGADSTPPTRGCVDETPRVAASCSATTTERNQTIRLKLTDLSHAARAYASALRRLDAGLDGRELDDAALATYLAEPHDAGRASSSASMAVAAACFRAKLAGQPAPADERTARVLHRGQARPFARAIAATRKRRSTR